MNKFGTRNMQSLVDRLRSEALASKEADPEGLGAGMVCLLEDAADTLDAAHRYYLAVESALV